MKMLFKMYLLGQLIAMPFMVGALGSAFGSSDSPVRITDAQSAAQATATVQQRFCDALHGDAVSNVQADLQQLKYVTDQLYEESLVDDCFPTPTP